MFVYLIEKRGVTTMENKHAIASAEIFYSKLINDFSSFPAKFRYSGKEYTGFPTPDFSATEHKSGKSKDKITDMFTLAGPENLTVTIETAYWCEYGVSEWTIGFENRGNADTALLSDVYCCVLDFEGKSPVLKGILGDHENDYRPYSFNLSEKPVYFESLSGRPTHVNFPYFNLEYGSGGAMIALGWAGSWSADFSADGNTTRFLGRSTVGMSLFLKPGEKIRTALTVIAPYYVRNEQYASNFWRKWFINCNMPKADVSGKDVEPFSTCYFAYDTGLPNSDGSISERYTTWKPSLDKMFGVGVKVDFRWFDAGWYSDPEGKTVESDWWGTVGSWELDPVKWPGKTFRESVDFTRAHGMKTLVWFEPERVTNPEALSRNYGYNTEWAIKVPGESAITNNIGNPDCLRWTTDRVCRMLRDNNVDMYREDNNSDPGALWRYLDGKDGRMGMTECRMVLAHYKMWDDIIETTKATGGCAFCDSCASGGGRNDIESLRRGIPILRSDKDRTTTSLRLSMTTSFDNWIPFTGASTKESAEQLDAPVNADIYIWRASYLPILNIASMFVYNPDQDFSSLRAGIAEWNKVKPYLLKDFYVLTPWHPENDRTGFTSYSYYDPEKQKGVLFIFRMEDCEDNSFRLTLPYAETGKTHVLTDADSESGSVYSPDMPVILDKKRTAKLYFVSVD